VVVPELELSVPSETDESHHETLTFCTSGVPHALSAVAEKVRTSRGVTEMFAGLAERLASIVEEQFSGAAVSETGAMTVDTDRSDPKTGATSIVRRSAASISRTTETPTAHPRPARCRSLRGLIALRTPSPGSTAPYHEGQVNRD
jgi:hypothetical protein